MDFVSWDSEAARGIRTFLERLVASRDAASCCALLEDMQDMLRIGHLRQGTHTLKKKNV